MCSSEQCEHTISQVIEFNPLGAVVGCIECDETLQFTAQEIADDYLPFTYTSPEGMTKDVHIFIHASEIK